jgi:predicted RNA binding protein YcfA (HicA-like mRNA interferase family)
MAMRAAGCRGLRRPAWPLLANVAVLQKRLEAHASIAASLLGSNRVVALSNHRDECGRWASAAQGWHTWSMKVSEILELLRKDGWVLIATRGSHRQFKHPSKPGRVTVAGKPSDDLAPGTLNSILKQASLKG